MNFIKLFFVISLFASLLFAQAEVLTNANIIEMSKVGLGKKLILEKINTSNVDFEVSTKSLIELKTAGVDEDVISVMLEKTKAKRQKFTQTETKITGSKETASFGNPQTPSEMLKNAKTVAIFKTSLNPSKQKLENALLKRADWKKFGIAITEYKETADLHIEIGFVPFSLVTHRYAYRIFDTRSGTVIAAGQATSWGSLSDNLAKSIIKELNKVATN
jgi:hypothetical protein